MKQKILYLLCGVILTILTNVPVFGYDFSGIGIHAGSGETIVIDLLLTNPQGRKTGVDLVADKGYREIPNAGYAWDKEPKINPSRTLYVGETPLTGIYTLKITSNALTTYWVEIDTDDVDGNSFAFKFDGVVAPGIISEYIINYDSTQGMPSLAVRVATIHSTKQDITLSYDVGWITNKGIMNSLLSKLDTIENAINRGQKKTATNQLNAFINEVNAQKDKHIKENAAKILIEDAEYLINHL